MTSLSAHRIDQPAAAGDELKPGVEKSAPQSAMKRLMKIAHRPKLFLQPARVDFCLIRGKLRGRSIAGAERFVDGLGGEHSALDRRVNALQPLRIEQARAVSGDQPAIQVCARHRIPAAVRHGLRTVTHELSAFEYAFDEGMRLKFLKRFVRVEQRIRIFEADNGADRNAIVAKTIDPPAAIFVRTEGIAERVRHITRIDAARLNVPKFLDADPVNLRVQPIEFQSIYEVLRERAARAFGKERDLRAQLISRREIVLWLAVFIHALVFGEDSRDPVALVEKFPASKLRKKVHALLFDKTSEPFHQLIERNHVIAVIAQRRRDRKSVV